MVDADYDALIRAVEAAGFAADFQPVRTPGDRLRLNTAENGARFWVARRGTTWFIATWLPHIYRIPAEAPIESLALEALRSCRGTPYDLKPELKSKYGLVEVSDEEFDRA